MTAESARWPVPSYEMFRRELTMKGSFAQQFSFDRAVTRAALRTGRGPGRHRHPAASGSTRYGAALAAVAGPRGGQGVLVP